MCTFLPGIHLGVELLGHCVYQGPEDQILLIARLSVAIHSFIHSFVHSCARHCARQWDLVMSRNRSGFFSGADINQAKTKVRWCSCNRDQCSRGKKQGSKRTYNIGIGSELRKSGM